MHLTSLISLIYPGQSNSWGWGEVEGFCDLAWFCCDVCILASADVDGNIEIQGCLLNSGEGVFAHTGWQSDALGILHSYGERSALGIRF